MVCGVIEQSYFPKSPSAWFKGKVFREAVLVKFVDSFQEREDDYGWARISLSESTSLSWEILRSPQNGMVSDQASLKRDTGTESSNATKAEICGPLEQMTPLSGLRE